MERDNPEKSGYTRLVIKTNDGIEIPQTSRIERVIGKLLFNRLGGAFVLATSHILGKDEPGEVQRVRTLMRNLRTLIDIEEAFNKGEIEGLLLPEDDTSLEQLNIKQMEPQLEAFRESRN